MTVLKVLRKTISVLLVLCILTCAVLFAKEFFFDRKKTEREAYTVENIPPDQRGREFSSISLISGEKGFHIMLGAQDCFANFYHAAAGERLPAKLKITNMSDQSASVVLTASNGGGKPTKAEIDLLSSYTDIKITTADGLVFYRGKLWNEQGESRGISLGTYSAGESKELLAEITLSPETGAEAAAACRRIAWIFSGLRAQGVIAAPKGFYLTAGVFMIVSVCLAGILIGLTIAEKRKKRSG